MSFNTNWTVPLIVSVGFLLAGCNADQGDDTATTADAKQMQTRAQAFLDTYLGELDQRWHTWTLTEWDAATTGSDEAFAAHADADLALRQLRSDPERYREIQEVLAHGDLLLPLQMRSLQIAELAFKGNQLPVEVLKDLSDRSAAIGQIFNTFRAEFDGAPYSNNELLDMLAAETNSSRRQVIWQALKQVGSVVASDIVELAKVRNDAARQLGYDNFWEMQIRLQEHDPDYLMHTFGELESLTNDPFRTVKTLLDENLAKQFGITPDQMMPWHYDNPFFQAAPPSTAVNLDEFYKHMKKEDIADLAVVFFDDIDLPVEDIVARSDLYDREGKDQHAFCENMDRKGDVRVLCNLRPNAEWMDVMLHELGHAVYEKYLDISLPFNLRSANHMFTTEGIAMLFGALAKTPSWIVAYTGADSNRVAEVSHPIFEQRQREQLIFCRWTLVMLHFEKSLYENPDQDLNTLWWDLVERFQYLTRPTDRNEPDWAAKPHIALYPVYYHNYQLGELFAAQLRSKLAQIAGHDGSTSSLSFNGRKEFGDFLRNEIFKPGSNMPWPEFVLETTGSELSARFFAAELE